MQQKRFRLAAHEIKPVAPGHGSCIASDLVTVQGLPVLFMYREEPSDSFDSGWRFFSGQEDDEYSANSANFAVVDVNTIANYDAAIIELLAEVVGSAFERPSAGQRFQVVAGWAPPTE